MQKIMHDEQKEGRISIFVSGSNVADTCFCIVKTFLTDQTHIKV